MPVNKQHSKLISREVLFLAVFASISGLLFVWLAQEVVIKKNDLFDTLAFNYFQQWVSPTNTTIARIVTRGGSDVFLIVIYLWVIYYFLRNTYKRQAVQLVIIVSASFLWSTLLKQFFHRPRPSLPHLDYVISYSFPSGHTLSTFTLCGILAWLAFKSQRHVAIKLTATIALFLYACMIGISRIYLHVHYLSDVLAGACFALLWLAISAIVINLTEQTSFKIEKNN